MNFKSIQLLLFYVVLLTIGTNVIFAQTANVTKRNVTDTLKIGGTHKKDNQYYQAPKKIKLDNALLSVTYQFKHGVVNNKNISFVIDTMVLVAGNEYSIYFDRNDLNKREAFSSYFTDHGPIKVFYSTPYSEFAEIAVNDNYLFSPSIFGETFQLYKDRKRNVITIMDFDNSNFEAEELFYFHEEENSPIRWEIKGDTISVLGYICSKATCDFGGRSYNAWFTQNIPINEGPYKFYGLPGMILKIEDSEKYFQFEAIGLENMENTEIIIDEKSKYLKCTTEEYRKLKKRQQENFTEYYRKGDVLHYTFQKSGIEYISIEKDVNRK